MLISRRVKTEHNGEQNGEVLQNSAQLIQGKGVVSHVTCAHLKMPCVPNSQGLNAANVGISSMVVIYLQIFH